MVVNGFDYSWPALTKAGWRRVDRQMHRQMEYPALRSTRMESLYPSREVATDAVSQ